jgi:hypothetical protein
MSIKLFIVFSPYPQRRADQLNRGTIPTGEILGRADYGGITGGLKGRED